jgi:hypothetical protein
VLGALEVLEGTVTFVDAIFREARGQEMTIDIARKDEAFVGHCF